MLDTQPEQQQPDVSQLLNALSALVANQASVAIPACGMCAFVTVAGCVGQQTTWQKAKLVPCPA